MGRSLNFEDDFEEIVFYLRKMFNQKKSIIPSSMVQRHALAILKQDRYTVITHHNKPRFVMVDVRLMNKVREAMVRMGEIRNDPLLDGDIPDPRKRIEPKPDRLTFSIDDTSSQEDNEVE